MSSIETGGTMSYNFADFNQKYAGGYRIGGPTGLQVNLKKKPNWFHRTMMRLCLGWEWVDA